MSSDPQKCVSDLLTKAGALCDTAKTAERNRHTLDGSGYYGTRLHKQLIEMAETEAGFVEVVKASGLKDSLPELRAYIDTIQSVTPKGKERQDAMRALERMCHSKVIPAIKSATLPPTPTTEKVLLKSVVIPTKDNYLIGVVVQANACYEARCFDAAAVMIRKLIESLIISVYEANNKASEIKNHSTGDFFMLADLVSALLGASHWSLGRDTKATLPKVKQLGDRSAHSRRYLATKPDVDAVTQGLRVAVDELLHLAKLK